MSEILTRLQAEEDALVFSRFDETDVWVLGCLLADTARAGQAPVAIDISSPDRVLFHYACPGATPDNGYWIARKRRTVFRFGRSSLAVGEKLRQAGKTIEEKYLISEQEYAAHGGSFPVRVKNVGVVAAVTVSGLAQAEDHAMVVAALQQLQRQQNTADT
ncbi:heme-degrading domain-containing protein [Spirochaeta africana]|uniref:Uncharacterized protein n=1 Tax=Spirochaeta africana (strain ATCC 700263 / DSM 8902 / Z-7692) TaxID=889378 RepID=H9UHN1_SPIAZ|nr:heme-degrading domain-containing protein [Spirochaeta africana]AFG37024.1 hypothetical protein Spiaf_0935 [Spirochaeta africana DSM 8902]